MYFTADWVAGLQTPVKGAHIVTTVVSKGQLPRAIFAAIFVAQLWNRLIENLLAIKDFGLIIIGEYYNNII